VQSTEGARVRKAALLVAGLIFVLVMAVSLVLALTSQINLPGSAAEDGRSAPSPYVVVEVVEGGKTTYTTTYTTTPQESMVVVVFPEVLVIVSGNHTSTVTTTVTTTSTTWV
jgi:biopolymer transport protein ExbD